MAYDSTEVAEAQILVMACSMDTEIKQRILAIPASTLTENQPAVNVPLTTSSYTEGDSVEGATFSLLISPRAMQITGQCQPSLENKFG